ncbi:hypothetical protein [Pontiella agarivorans]|uniref:Uncharacterized protein n=1 Tax=Pontiella agarivorans TaxID=3038953 RepID=A0ABU5MTG6_9BACT|nr:hypothetical protein [Pontiella agarivorans]MDZ8117501.1 hypothetical protein [Pontiella agarivorans]
MSLNQAVLFTKPLHHLGIDLTPEKLDELSRTFFEDKGFEISFSKKVTGPQLAERDVIRQHYILYSTAAWAEDISMSDAGKKRFAEAFDRSWDEEVSVGRILPTAELLKRRAIDSHQLFNFWNSIFSAGETVKLQDGFIMGYIAELDAYCINGFYPSMEANFYHPDTVMTYYVVEFDSSETSWSDFRKKILGSTNASNAVHESFRGQLYSEYPVQFPGRDNFLHGSAGPLEGLVERAIHETDFDITANPVGQWLNEKGITLDRFQEWKTTRSVSDLGNLFDETEEKNTDEIFQVLETVKWS